MRQHAPKISQEEMQVDLRQVHVLAARSHRTRNGTEAILKVYKTFSKTKVCERHLHIDYKISLGIYI